jgi:hypothetical protein
MLLRLDVAYDGIQTEENRLQSKNKSNWGFSKFAIPPLKDINSTSSVPNSKSF